MSPQLVASLIFLAGLIGLVWSAHYFVGGSASLAKHLGMTPGLIGLTVVAFGTSAPEILVAGSAALEGAPDLGVGNAIGSNIANIGLVLGATALVAKLPVSHWLMRLEVPLLVIATALAAWILFDHQLSRTEGLVLLGVAALLPLALLLDLKYHKVARDEDIYPVDEDEIPDLPLGKSIIWLCGGLMILLLSADLLVGAATALANFFGVSPMIIGLTVVALGTSLPELAASIASAVKGHHEMAVGNIIGSNVLNILLVMAIPAIIMPTALDPQVFTRDALTMMALTLILLALIFFKTSRGQAGKGYIGRSAACLLLLIYIGYYAVLFTGSKL
ncbi:MAG: calcium/sodium antiporter [Gammaproteobacteria bacterium]|nr:calcium/sodium antiporter [Gammaproteobacteria bacterium]NND40377.1 calcium/sodium antiporter [Pseudomonadales bacterium]MBT8150530.1 calcium/sodium antiporter [Gammaproteobacteria bacterium]NNL10409.1 calcium/sodium antiporter [Pseudomonadales bacterium]NNM12560.1 calcium/sodium antiporter [Pseudomonadales bacterium]